MNHLEGIQRSVPQLLKREPNLPHEWLGIRPQRQSGNSKHRISLQREGVGTQLVVDLDVRIKVLQTVNLNYERPTVDLEQRIDVPVPAL